MRIDLFCSGSKGNSCLIRTENAKVLIDCGPSTKRYMTNSLKDAGVSPGDLDALLITHSHSDHIRQLAMFESVPVYTCCELHAKNSRREEVMLDLHEIVPPAQFTVGDLTIQSFPTSHDSGPSMGFVFYHNNEKLVYVTDTGYIRSDYFDLLSDADYYIFESNHDLQMLSQTNRPYWLKARIASDTGHLCNADSARLLSHFISSRTRHIVLAHLSEEANTPQLALKTLHDRLNASGIDCSKMVIEAAGQWQPLHFGTEEQENERQLNADEAKKTDLRYSLLCLDDLLPSRS